MTAAAMVDHRLCFAIASPDVVSMPIAWTGDTGTICRTLADLGYGGVEVQVRDAAAFDTHRFRATVADAGLVLVGVSTGPAAQEGLVIATEDKAVCRATVDRLKRIADFAAESDASVAIGSIRGGSRTAGSLARAEDLFREALVELTDHVRGSRTAFLVEPQSRGVTDLFNTVASAMTLVGDLPPEHVALELDTFHAHHEEPSVCGALVAAHAAGRLAHVQIADTNRLTPGRGDLPWREVLGVLEAVGYDGWISVEVEQHQGGALIAEEARSFLAGVVRERAS